MTNHDHLLNQASGRSPLALSVAFGTLLTCMLSSVVWAQHQYVFTQFAGTPAGAGYYDGAGEEARFGGGITSNAAADSAGNLFFGDSQNGTIRMVTPQGVVTTFAGAPGQSYTKDGDRATARFRGPAGIAIDASGTIFVADEHDSVIRKISPDGVVTTFAGTPGSRGSADGHRSVARFNGPAGLALGPDGTLYVTDISSSTIRRITPAGIVSTLAGMPGTSGAADGIGSAARFRRPYAIAVGPGGALYVADAANHTIRQISESGTVSTLAGYPQAPGSTDGNGSAARFNFPTGITADAAGNLYVADSGNRKIRKISPEGNVTTWATAACGALSNIVSSGSAFLYTSDGIEVSVLTADATVRKIAGRARIAGVQDGVGADATFDGPSDLAIDASGNTYLVDYNQHTLRKVTPDGSVSTIAGFAGAAGFVEGVGSAARFNKPEGVAVDATGNVVVADTGNRRLRRVSPSGTVTTVAGSGVTGTRDGSGVEASFGCPTRMAFDTAGNLLICDPCYRLVRKMTPEGQVSTVLDLQTPPGDGPHGVAVDRAGNVFLAHGSGNVVVKATAAGSVSVFAGSGGVAGHADGVGAGAQFGGPFDLAVDADDNLYLVEWAGLVRKITPQGAVSTIGGQFNHVVTAEGTGAVARFRSPAAIGVTPSGELAVIDSGAILKGQRSLSDFATIDAGFGYAGMSRQLDVGSATATAFAWRQVVIPTGSRATLSSTTVRAPTFTPDVTGHYEFLLRATSPSGTSITIVRLDAVFSPFGAPPAIIATASGVSAVDVTWSPVDAAASYEVWRRSAGVDWRAISVTTSPSYRDSAVAPDRAYLYAVRARAVDGSISSASQVDAATTVSFSDEPLLPGTIVRAAHFMELRAAINALREAAGLESLTFGDGPVIAGTSMIMAAHVTALRQALDTARAAAGLPAWTYGDVVIARGGSIRRTHVEELRAAVR